MVRLVFIDVDGTLHGPQGVPDCAWEAARRARQAGLRLSLATGRPSAGVSLEYARRLDPESPHVFHQGAAVVSADGRALYASPLPRDAFHRLVDLSRASALPLEAYTAEGGFYSESRSRDIDAHGRLLQVNIERRDLQAVWQLGTVIRLQWVVRESAEWLRVRRLIDEDYAGRLSWHLGTSPATPGVLYASLLDSHAGKLAAARWVAERLGADFAEVAMIGDGENDLELLRQAGVGVAMGNAPDTVKRAADWVAPPVEECGLAAALDWLITRNQTAS